MDREERIREIKTKLKESLPCFEMCESDFFVLQNGYLIEINDVRRATENVEGISSSGKTVTYIQEDSKVYVDIYKSIYRAWDANPDESNTFIIEEREDILLKILSLSEDFPEKLTDCNHVNDMGVEAYPFSITQVQSPVNLSIFSIIKNIIENMRDMEGDYLTVVLESAQANIDFIQTTRQENDDRFIVEIGIKTAYERPEMYGLDNVNLNDTVRIFKEICYDRETPRLTEWNNITEKVFSENTVE